MYAFVKYPSQSTAKRTFEFKPTFSSFRIWFKRLFQTQCFEKKDLGRCFEVLTTQPQFEIITRNADIEATFAACVDHTMRANR